MSSHPSSPWKNNLTEWKAARSSYRLKEDERRLQLIFELAAKVPVAKEALEWAQAHGIEFVIDHTCHEGIRGYYTGSTGVIAISELHSLPTPQIIATLTHEIRHAWQDWHKMVASEATDFKDAYIQTALIEADATAHGDLAEAQCLAMRRGQDPLTPEQEQQILWSGFKNWFQSPRALVYGTDLANTFAVKLGIDGIPLEDYRLEFKPPVADMDGFDVNDRAKVKTLSNAFNKASYFPANVDTALDKIVSDFALHFYFQANDDEKQLVEKIRKTQNGRKIKFD